MDQAPGRDQPDRCNVALKVNKQKFMSSYVMVGKRKGRFVFAEWLLTL